MPPSPSRPRFPLALALAGACLCGALARPAAAQSHADSAAAQALFDQARALMEAGRVAEACPKLEESQRLDPGSGTLLNLARCYEASGRLATAWTTYLEAAGASRTAGNPEREAAAREFAASLEPRLSRLVIDLVPGERPRGLEITRDGERVGAPQWRLPIPADEGEHLVAATAPGHAPWQTTVRIEGEGQVVTVTVPALVPEPEADRDADATADAGPGLGSQRTLALVAGGVGVVGLGLGTAFGLRSMAKHDEAERFCDGPACTDVRGVDAGDAAQSAGNVSTVAFVIGGLGVAAGLTLWFTAPEASGGAEARLDVGPGSVRVSGRF
jgi:hypothetical protein